jgi:hypothetical protein
MSDWTPHKSSEIVDTLRDARAQVRG